MKVGEIEDYDLASTVNLDQQEVCVVMKDLEHLGLVTYTEKEGPGPDPRIFFEYQITSVGMQTAERLRRNARLEYQNLENNPIFKKVDTIGGDSSMIKSQLNSLSQKADRLESAIEDETYRRPKFVESSPGNRTFGKEIEGVLSNILHGDTKDVEIFIMGYFDHDSLDKLKEVLAAKGKVRIIHPELTGSKQDQGNLDALRRVEKSGAEVRVHPMLHARIFYLSRDGQPWGVIVGSGDIKSDCLGGRRFDAGIWSNHPDVIQSAVNFFKRVWDDEGVKSLSEFRQVK